MNNVMALVVEHPQIFADTAQWFQCRVHALEHVKNEAKIAAETEESVFGILKLLVGAHVANGIHDFL